jgi:hypothetical protein
MSKYCTTLRWPFCKYSFRLDEIVSEEGADDDAYNEDAERRVMVDDIINGIESYDLD